MMYLMRCLGLRRSENDAVADAPPSSAPFWNIRSAGARRAAGSWRRLRVVQEDAERMPVDPAFVRITFLPDAQSHHKD